MLATHLGLSRTILLVLEHPMKQLLGWLITICKVAIFFTLFAFALNNLEDVSLKFFFGRQWTGPMILVVLAVFSLGVMVGVLGMLPRWWAHRRWESSKLNAEKNAFSPMTSGSNSTDSPVNDSANRNPPNASQQRTDHHGL
jgi:uncharacterized integral membrane protein